jgi:hypothetical protein
MVSTKQASNKVQNKQSIKTNNNYGKSKYDNDSSSGAWNAFS